LIFLIFLKQRNNFVCDFQDAAIGFGLLATGVVVFSLMFLPRGRQLAAMGRDGRYAEDGGEERFSSLSPSAMAGYSPSFFHFKPAPAQTILTSKNGNGYYPPHLMGGEYIFIAIFFGTHMALV